MTSDNMSEGWSEKAIEAAAIQLDPLAFAPIAHPPRGYEFTDPDTLATMYAARRKTAIHRARKALIAAQAQLDKEQQDAK